MPNLQLDVTKQYPLETKRILAKRLGEIFSSLMHSNINRMTVTIRELGEGGVWRCTDGEPYPAALLMCDIRKGRTKEKRAGLSEKLLVACIEILGLKKEELNIEFTQHEGDEMYHPMRGGLSDDWVADEA